MFVKLKKINGWMGYNVSNITEIILNKKSIAKINLEDTSRPRCHYAGKTINICTIELMNGEAFEVIGKPVLDDGDLSFTET